MLVVLVLFIALIFYCYITEKQAKAAAREFCDQTPMNASESETLSRALLTKAKKRPLKWYVDKNNKGKFLPVMFEGMSFLSRHTCFVQAMEGKVVSREYEYLD
jgi:hypothetical protein